MNGRTGRLPDHEPSDQFEVVCILRMARVGEQSAVPAGVKGADSPLFEHGRDRGDGLSEQADIFKIVDFKKQS